VIGLAHIGLCGIISIFKLSGKGKSVILKAPEEYNIVRVLPLFVVVVL
jgi:hypothetical protein